MAKAGITEVPTTWPDVIKDAKIIKDKGILQYPLVWSWSQAEAMICDYTVLMSAYNGSFLTADGAPAFQTGGGLDALNFMVATMKDGTTNPHSTEYLEEDVRRVFSAGQAAFALNWSYMWSLAQYNAKESKVTGQVGVEVSPGVPGRSKISSVNGAMGLGIPTSSTNADAAWDYITYLTSQPVEDAYTADAIPSWKASFQDPKLMDGDEGPMARAMEQAEGQLFPAPSCRTTSSSRPRCSRTSSRLCSARLRRRQRFRQPPTASTATDRRRCWGDAPFFCCCPWVWACSPSSDGRWSRPSG